MTEVEYFFTTGEVFTIYEWETWTYAMKEFYRTKIGEEAYSKMVDHINVEFSQNMDDEVAKDKYGAAQYLAQDMLSNADDFQVSQMHDISAPPVVI